MSEKHDCCCSSQQEKEKKECYEKPVLFYKIIVAYLRQENHPKNKDKNMGN